MAKVSVLHVTLGLSIGQPLGGAERLVVELVRHLDRTRFEPIVCAFWRHNTEIERYWADVLTEEGIETFFAQDWPGKHTLSAHLRGMANIVEHLRTRPLDIVHSHFQMGSVAALVTKPRLQASALVRTAHPGKEWGDGPMAYLCRQVFTKWVFPLCFDAQTAVSTDGLDRINAYPGTRISRRSAVLIPNGIPLERFSGLMDSQHARRELGIPADSLVIGNVARLSREKGHRYLLQAASKVIEQIPNARFLIVGDGALRDTLQEQAHRLGLDDVILWAGSQANVEPFYRAMDLFVLSSVWEGLPIAILESMACGIPVIASDLAGIRQIIRHRDTGWLVAPGCPEALADCIMEALRNQGELRQVAQRALSHVVPSYSLESVADRYERLYTCVVSRKPSSCLQAENRP